MIKKIAFIGATGMIGKPVASELVSAGFTVTALVRDISKARTELPETIHLIPGNIKYRQDLENLLRGQDALYINLNIKHTEKKNDYHTESDGLKIILEVAKKSGIKRVAFISSLVMRYQGMNNFRWWVFDVKRESIRLIKSCGIPYTIFYPTTFIENFDGVYRQGNRMLLAGRSIHKMYFISSADYAKQVVRSFQVLQNENKEYTIQGPEGFTADEAVAEYVNHYKKEKLIISKAPLVLLKFLGLFIQKFHYGSHIVEALNNYPEKFESENTWKELGKPTVTIREFAQQKG
jgi:uncharacterized protein YbjT (DUF2867 family)